MSNGKAATLPRTSSTASESDEYLAHIAPYHAIEDAVDALHLPGALAFPGLPDDIYDRHGDDIDRLSSGIIDLLAEHCPGVLKADGDLLPPSHIIMAGIDHAVWYALTEIAGAYRPRHCPRRRVAS